MPTGYTAAVVDGKITEFRQFALQCARAFGALIIMRDDPWDAQIPDKFEPDDYHSIRLEEARKSLRHLETMTSEEVAAACAEDFANRNAERRKWKADQALENERLDAMGQLVEAWTPPSANHGEMKTFMLEQIRISRHDLDAIDRCSPVEDLPPTEWYRDRIKKAHKDIGYHAGEHAKEIERAEGRTLWVKQLRDSLDGAA